MTQETSQPAAAVEGLDDYFWDDLLAYIEEKRVIPIIGPDLISVEVEGRETLLYCWLAQRLAPRLSVPVQALPAEFSLNEVLCEFLSRRGRREDVYPRLRMIMREASFSPPEALRQLAAITDFNLYVATTFDSLLEQAINEVRFNGKMRTEVLSYAPNKLVDLRCEKDRLEYPTVYHLLGKLAAAPSYAICDEDILEFICTLQSENFCPETLFSELENNNLLILGCGFSDWWSGFSFGWQNGTGSPIPAMFSKSLPIATHRGTRTSSCFSSRLVAAPKSFAAATQAPSSGSFGAAGRRGSLL